MKLAEVQEEADNMEEAIREYQNALELRKAHLEPHSRLIAETLSALAFAYSIERRNDEALQSYLSAFDVISLRKQFLEKQHNDSSLPDKGKGKERSDDSHLGPESAEYKELTELLTDVQEKIDALKGLKQDELPMRGESAKMAESVFAAPLVSTAASGVSASLAELQEPAGQETAHPAKPTVPVHHLGVFGRSSKKNSSSSSASSSSSGSQVTSTNTEPKAEGSFTKRKRNDMEDSSANRGDDTLKQITDLDLKKDEAVTKRQKVED